MTGPEPTLSSIDKELERLRKQRALAFLLEGGDNLAWAQEEVIKYLHLLDYEQLRVLSGLLQVITSRSGITHESSFRLKTDWDITRRNTST